MIPYWTSELYGCGKWLRKYGYYPSFLPLCVYSNHGLGFNAKPAKHELESDAPVQLYNYFETAKRFRELSDKPCYVFPSPFAFARKKLGVEAGEGHGSIFFVPHSTASVEDRKPWQDYHKELNALPNDYKPLVLCFHPTDVEKGLHKVYQDLGYETTTAGKSLDPNFTERFYGILSRFRYGLSNQLGSYVYYCIEMGIPFGLYGEEPQLFNKGDRNIEKGPYVSYKQNERYQEATKLFAGLPSEIGSDQQAFIREGMGLDEGISRWRMARVLYGSFFKWISRPRNFSVWYAESYKEIEKMLTKILSKILDLSPRKVLQKFKLIRPKEYARKAELRPLSTVVDYITPSEYNRLNHLSRYESATVDFLGGRLQIIDNSSFISMIQELYVNGTYEFKSESPNPYVIDCGANIGLGVLHIKQQYPSAEVDAFEPDESAFTALNQNIANYNLEHVRARKAAVWTENTNLNFQVEGSWGGYLSDNGESTVQVEAVDLKGFLNRRIDFLKMDIEGAENKVLIDAREGIAKHVQHLFFEWHSMNDEPQRLPEILGYFKDQGFRFHIKEASQRDRPFVNRPQTRMDSQLDCFLYRA